MDLAVIIGSGGRLGAALFREWRERISVRGFNHQEVDLAKTDQIKAILDPMNFDLLVNAAALTNVDYCESHEEETYSINAQAPQQLAEICRQKNAKLVHISTDYVFDGKKRQPYKEDDEARPAGIYARSKLEGEERVLQVAPNHLVVRMSWVFGPDRPSFIDQIIARARTTSEVSAVADKFSTPTYTLDAARWLWQAWDNKIEGLLHLTNSGACSWQEYAQYALDCCNRKGVALRAKKVAAFKLADMNNFIAPRPVYSVLGTDKFRQMTGENPRDWQEAVAEYIAGYIT